MRLSRRVRAIAVAASAAGLALTMTGAGSASADPGGYGAGHGRRAFDHLYVIMLENHSKSSVIGDQYAPFITGLSQAYGTASRYYGVTHPSMPNYIAATAGDNFGIQDDNDQNASRTTTTRTSST